MTEDPTDFLRAAQNSIRAYNNAVDCGWCKGKATKMVMFLQELIEVTPIAKEMSEKINTIQGFNLEKMSDELREARQSLSPAVAPPLATVAPVPAQPIPISSGGPPPAPPAPFTGKAPRSVIRRGLLTGDNNILSGVRDLVRIKKTLLGE